MGLVVVCAVVVALAVIGVLLLERHLNQRLAEADTFEAELCSAAMYEDDDEDEVETSAERARRLRGARVYDAPGVMVARTHQFEFADLDY